MLRGTYTIRRSRARCYSPPRRRASRRRTYASCHERQTQAGETTGGVFDRYNIIHEQELLDAGDQLVAYLAQQAPAAPARRRPHAVGPAAPLRLVRRGTKSWRWCADSARWASSGRHVGHRDRRRVMISM